MAVEYRRRFTLKDSPVVLSDLLDHIKNNGKAAVLMSEPLIRTKQLGPSLFETNKPRIVVESAVVYLAYAVSPIDECEGLNEFTRMVFEGVHPTYAREAFKSELSGGMGVASVHFIELLATIRNAKVAACNDCEALGRLGLRSIRPHSTKLLRETTFYILPHPVLVRLMYKYEIGRRDGKMEYSPKFETLKSGIMPSDAVLLESGEMELLLESLRRTN